MKKDVSSLDIKLSNTLTNKKEPLIPLHKNKVLMYVCGVTPYDYAHIGHARVYVVFDVLYRLLKLFDFNVIYCRNFTDIDDKIINRAIEEFNDPNQFNKISFRFIKAFEEDMKRLNCLKPDCEPKVTNHIPEIIEFIKGLIKKGKAYESDGDIYFSVESFKDYGKLSKRDLSDLKVGARVEVREEKQNPLDFALWKRAESGPGWESPWGYGRPGWHIECSALAKKYLGETIDIHAGGMDLIFPHHENEIAQSEGLHDKEFARYWVHNAFVLVNKEKMSKSLGNFVTIRDLFQEYDPMVIRYYILVHHYRSPLDFTRKDILAASKGYQKLIKFFSSFKVKNDFEFSLNELPLICDLLKALTDDLNISRVFGLIFENLELLEKDNIQAGIAKSLIQQVLGLDLKPIEEFEIEITPEIEHLIKERERARKAKDWAKADAIREQLRALGFEVQDKKTD